jgi:hypothetical protein
MVSGHSSLRDTPSRPCSTVELATRILTAATTSPWAWRRGGDDRHPCFLTEREAVDYMADRLRRIAAFER